jgi:hypothetical protein
MNIPGLFVQFLKSLDLPFRFDCNMLSMMPCLRRVLSSPPRLKAEGSRSAGPALRTCGTSRAEASRQSAAGSRRRVVVSFGMASLLKRRRKSSPWTAHLRRFAEWIPAFAGMAVARSVHVSQMTPLPGAGEESNSLFTIYNSELPLSPAPVLPSADA